MCVCDPNLRTPYCGRGDCIPPSQRVEVAQNNAIPKEPEIIINGVHLGAGAAMTIRVAIENFAMDLQTDGLGKDKLGVSICKGYLDRINDIRKAMFSERRYNYGKG